jgi:hypothetical protein
MSPAHKDEFDSTLKNLSLNEIHMSYVLQPRDGVIYRGRVGYLSLWTYSATYTDPETGATLKPLGDYDVLIGGASIDGVRHFGRIKDLSAQLSARQYFVKSRELFDPSGYEFLMQSAPLACSVSPEQREAVEGSLSVRVRGSGCVIVGTEGRTPPLPYVTVSASEGAALIGMNLAVEVDGLPSRSRLPSQPRSPTRSRKWPRSQPPTRRKAARAVRKAKPARKCSSRRWTSWRPMTL